MKIKTCVSTLSSFYIPGKKHLHKCRMLQACHFTCVQMLNSRFSGDKTKSRKNQTVSAAGQKDGYTYVEKNQKRVHQIPSEQFSEIVYFLSSFLWDFLLLQPAAGFLCFNLLCLPEVQQIRLPDNILSFK